MKRCVTVFAGNVSPGAWLLYLPAGERGVASKRILPGKQPLPRYFIGADRGLRRPRRDYGARQCAG
ncbi:MAG: hypothetical protein GTO29_08140 [Candidatus Latescibacteria bacterium]|nr:hypothetical protein [Candidatus Latescibacterota bacterium]NIO56131.1 hypothetical protein [Candidatus Latescibacterota bacterium]